MPEIESWMITLALILFTVISQFAINRYQNSEFKIQIKKLFTKYEMLEKNLSENVPLLNHLSKVDDENKNTISSHGEKIASIEEKIHQLPTMEKARNEFVSKEMFVQLEKHMDGQFKMIRETQTQILQEIRKIN